MRIDTAYLKELSSIFKDLVFTLGIIIGGIWAYFKFRKLNVYKESILKIEELQKKLKEQPVVRASIDASLKSIGDDRYIVGEILISNSGNKNTFLDFRDSVCKATEIENNEIEETLFGNVYNGYIDYETYVLRAGNQLNIPFIIKVKNQSIHLVDFWISVPKNDQDVYIDMGVYKRMDKTYWGTQKYVIDESKWSRGQ